MQYWVIIICTHKFVLNVIRIEGLKYYTYLNDARFYYGKKGKWILKLCQLPLLATWVGIACLAMVVSYLNWNLNEGKLCKFAPITSCKYGGNICSIYVTCQIVHHTRNSEVDGNTQYTSKQWYSSKYLCMYWLLTIRIAATFIATFDTIRERCTTFN